MTRCLFVTTALPPERGGGAERYAVQLSTRLTARDFTIDLLGRNPGSWSTSTEVRDGVTWVRLGAPVHDYFGYLAAVHAWLAAHAADYDVIQFFDLNVVSAAGVHATRNVPTPRVVRDEGVAVWALQQLEHTRVPLLARWARRWLLRADHYVVVSSPEVEQLGLLGIEADAVTFLPNGIDGGEYYPLPLQADPVIVCPARLRAEKNHRFLLEVFARVMIALPSARLIIAGDGPELASVREYAAELGVASSIEFLGHVDDMLTVYRRARVIALFSAAEGPSLGVLEGAACARPAVVSDVGGLVDSVRDGVTGYRVQVADVDAASERLARLLQDDEECRRMGARAAEFVAEERSLERAADAGAAFLTDLAHGTTYTRVRPKKGRD